MGLQPAKGAPLGSIGAQENALHWTNCLSAWKNRQDSEPRGQIGLTLLICFHIVCCCVAFYLGSSPDYYIFFDPNRVQYAVAAVAAFAIICPLFVFARFSFGYFAGFYLYTMVLGYLWLNCFSPFAYHHRLAGVSAAISAVAFLLPALSTGSPITQLYVLSERNLERLLVLIMALALATALVGAVYNFRLVSIENIYEYRDQLQFPTTVNYLMRAIMTALLPFAFACYLALKKPWLAAAILLICGCYYPITLSKVALFTPAWLCGLALLSKVLEARRSAIMSLFLPILVGILLLTVFGEAMRFFFNLLNLRMIIVPSSAMDIYNEYFAHHDLTYFCQVWLIKPFVPCALEFPLGIEMQNNYALGNFNASLFATEGIASVGLWLAPVTVFLCGAVVALCNRLSAGLPPRFILVSGGLFPQILLNVPFTTVLLTHGLGILCLLWYITPRELIARK
jgi:hypothetical protein